MHSTVRTDQFGVVYIHGRWRWTTWPLSRLTSMFVPAFESVSEIWPDHLAKGLVEQAMHAVVATIQGRDHPCVEGDPIGNAYIHTREQNRQVHQCLVDGTIAIRSDLADDMDRDVIWHSCSQYVGEDPPLILYFGDCPFASIIYQQVKSGFDRAFTIRGGSGVGILLYHVRFHTCQWSAAWYINIYIHIYIYMKSRLYIYRGRTYKKRWYIP